MNTLAGPESPIPMVTYTELLFIEAEAQKRLGNEAAASAAYDAAITASLEQCNVSATDIAMGTELEFVIMVIAVSCVKLLSAHNSTQHTSRKHKV
jgi:hypothetical protein